MSKIAIHAHAADGANSKSVEIDDGVTMEELAVAARAAGLIIERLEEDVAILIEREEKLVKRLQKLSDCGIKHGHHIHFRKHGRHHHDGGTIDLTVVVNGTPTEVKIERHAVLGSIIPIALEQTGNQGQPPENWELKDIKGNKLDVNKKIEDFHFTCDTKLFLSLRAGVGGQHGSVR